MPIKIERVKALFATSKCLHSHIYLIKMPRNRKIIPEIMYVNNLLSIHNKNVLKKKTLNIKTFQDAAVYLS